MEDFYPPREGGKIRSLSRPARTSNRRTHPAKAKKRFPLLAEESRHSRSEPRKYKHPQNEGCAVTYSFDTDAFGNFKVVEICEDGVVKPMDAPGEGKKRAPEAMQEREEDDGWDAKKGHGLMFGYVEERNPDNAC
mmetsp:Transcript_1831/g.6600  ORF Transcript_1831/g.6600 Transcript_1831/m.6600 type:complete len:135 (+) Transcript_1831:4191-4595(+)